MKGLAEKGGFMKAIISILLMVVGITANAGDRKIGTVVAVEREISDVYATCLKKTDTDTTKPKVFFSCNFKYINDGELAVTSGRLVTLMDDKCSVMGEAINGTVIITYSSSEKPSSFESSRACLARAFAGKDALKMLVYTIE